MTFRWNFESLLRRLGVISIKIFTKILLEWRKYFEKNMRRFRVYDACLKSYRPLDKEGIFLQKLGTVSQRSRHLGKYIWSITLKVSRYWQHMNSRQSPQSIHLQQQSLHCYLKISVFRDVFWDWGTSNNPGEGG